MTTMQVLDHELGGRLILQNGGTTIITTLPDYVGTTLRAFMKYGSQTRLEDSRWAEVLKQ